MTIVIYAVAIIMWFLLFKWTWSCARVFESDKIKKSLVLFGIMIIGIITLIDISISKSGIMYPKGKMFVPIRRILLVFFTPVNGFIVLPYLIVQLGKLDSDKIDSEEFIKNVKILLFIFLIILVIEYSYFKSIQLGILNIYRK